MPSDETLKTKHSYTEVNSQLCNSDKICLDYIDIVKGCWNIEPMSMKFPETQEIIKAVLVFHNASETTVGLLIYSHIQTETDWKLNKIKIARTSSKSGDASIPVLETRSR